MELNWPIFGLILADEQKFTIKTRKEFWMSTPAKIGKNEWRAAIFLGRMSNRDARQALRKLLAASNSPAVHALVAQLSLALAENDDALNRLDEVGRNSKNEQ
jgi:hypothetical protein